MGCLKFSGLMGYLTKSSSLKESAEIFFFLIPSSWLLGADDLGICSVLKSSRRIFRFSELATAVLGATIRLLKTLVKQISEFVQKYSQPNPLKETSVCNTPFKHCTSEQSILFEAGLWFKPCRRLK